MRDLCRPVTAIRRNPQPGQAPGSAPACRCAPATTARVRRRAAPRRADHAPQDVGQPRLPAFATAPSKRALAAIWRSVALSPRSHAGARTRTGSQRIVIPGRECAQTPSRRAGSRPRRTAASLRCPRACSQAAAIRPGSPQRCGRPRSGARLLAAAIGQFAFGHDHPLHANRSLSSRFELKPSSCQKRMIVGKRENQIG
jgi:hypothetical protein